MPKSATSRVERPRLPDSRHRRTSPGMNADTRAWIDAQLNAAPPLASDTARRIRIALWGVDGTGA